MLSLLLPRLPFLLLPRLPFLPFLLFPRLPFLLFLRLPFLFPPPLQLGVGDVVAPWVTGPGVEIVGIVGIVIVRVASSYLVPRLEKPQPWVRLTVVQSLHWIVELYQQVFHDVYLFIGESRRSAPKNQNRAQNLRFGRFWRGSAGNRPQTSRVGALKSAGTHRMP